MQSCNKTTRFSRVTLIVKSCSRKRIYLQLTQLHHLGVTSRMRAGLYPQMQAKVDQL